MKHRLITIVLLLLALPVLGQTAFEEGISAYSEARFSDAISAFEQAIDSSDKPTAAMYYNLGNAYYKSDELASAILAYERAYRLAPADRDIRYNLDLATSKTEDKITPAPAALLSGWVDGISHWFNLHTWVTLDIILLLLTCGLVLLYFFSGKRALRLTGFYAAMVTALLFIFTNAMTIRLNRFIQNPSGAVIMSPIVTIKSSPDQSATDIVVLHAGVRVQVQKAVASFYEVSLPDGVVGWIPQSDLEFILPR